MNERKFEQTKLTKTVIMALKRAINAIKPFAALDHCPDKKIQLAEYQDLLARIEKDQLDVSFVSREY